MLWHISYQHLPPSTSIYNEFKSIWPVHEQLTNVHVREPALVFVQMPTILYPQPNTNYFLKNMNVHISSFSWWAFCQGVDSHPIDGKYYLFLCVTNGAPAIIHIMSWHLLINQNVIMQRAIYSAAKPAGQCWLTKSVHPSIFFFSIFPEFIFFFLQPIKTPEFLFMLLVHQQFSFVPNARTPMPNVNQWDCDRLPIGVHKSNH